MKKDKTKMAYMIFLFLLPLTMPILAQTCTRSNPSKPIASTNKDGHHPEKILVRGKKDNYLFSEEELRPWVQASIGSCPIESVNLHLFWIELVEKKVGKLVLHYQL